MCKQWYICWVSYLNISCKLFCRVSCISPFPFHLSPFIAILAVLRNSLHLILIDLYPFLWYVMLNKLCMPCKKWDINIQFEQKWNELNPILGSNIIYMSPILSSWWWKESDFVPTWKLRMINGYYIRSNSQFWNSSVFWNHANGRMFNQL